MNDAPAGADNTVAAPQNSLITFTSADFGFVDANDTPANNFTRVKITAAPPADSLSVGATTLVAGSFVDAADIAAGLLKFTPATDATGVPYASFTFQVEDGGGTKNTGVDLDPSPNTMVIIIWKLTATANCSVADPPEFPVVLVLGNAVTLGTPRTEALSLAAASTALRRCCLH